MCCVDEHFTDSINPEKVGIFCNSCLNTNGIIPSSFLIFFESQRVCESIYQAGNRVNIPNLSRKHVVIKTSCLLGQETALPGNIFTEHRRHTRLGCYILKAIFWNAWAIVLGVPERSEINSPVDKILTEAKPNPRVLPLTNHKAKSLFIL